MNKFYHDDEYLNLVAEVLENGCENRDRTGTGTISTFAKQMRFALTNGTIPLLTTKKMHTKSIIHELLWYLQGTGSGKYLKENNIRIWDEWMEGDDHLNYVYGYQWRRWQTHEKGIVLIKKNTRQGDNSPFIYNAENSLIPDVENSDDLIGKIFHNKAGHTYRVIKKLSTGKNSSYLIQFSSTKFSTSRPRPAVLAGQIKDPYEKTDAVEGVFGRS